MLPIATDNGARLAAIFPSGIAAVARGIGADVGEVLDRAVGSSGVAPPDCSLLAGVRSFVMIVVDGLGFANLAARAGHAPVLSRLRAQRVETVMPSTTAAALTTLTTGALPGRHGLIGYRIRHPRLGLVRTLSQWEGVEGSTRWQRAKPLFSLAAEIGVRAVATGRPAHASGGLTKAILAGAEYVAGQKIEDRFDRVSQLLRSGESMVCYLYVDELDKAGHEFGWQSEAWALRLERFDAALNGFLRTLPEGVGVVVTADHGMVDVADRQQVLLDDDRSRFEMVESVGGDPRFRSLYLRDGCDVVEAARGWAATESRRAYVVTRDEAIASGMFGPVDAEVACRLGDVILIARQQLAYYSSSDDARARAMIGQHGSLSDDERGVPLALAGAFAGGGFGAAVTRIAADRFGWAGV